MAKKEMSEITVRFPYVITLSIIMGYKSLLRVGGGGGGWQQTWI